MTVKTKKERIISVTLTTVFNIAFIIAATMTVGWETAIGKGIAVFIVIISEFASLGCFEVAIIPFVSCFTIVLGLVCLESNEQIYNHAVELYNNGQYKDALDLYFEKKDEFVKAMAEDFKDIIDKRAYDALMEYSSRELYLEKFGDYPKEYYE